MPNKSTPQSCIGSNEKEFLCNLVALCPDGVIAIDRSGLITIFNRAAELLTGHSADETINKMNISDLYPSPQIARKIKKLIYLDATSNTSNIVFDSLTEDTILHFRTRHPGVCHRDTIAPPVGSCCRECAGRAGEDRRSGG